MKQFETFALCHLDYLHNIKWQNMIGQSIDKWDSFWKWSRKNIICVIMNSQSFGTMHTYILELLHLKNWCKLLFLFIWKYHFFINTLRYFFLKEWYYIFYYKKRERSRKSMYWPATGPQMQGRVDARIAYFSWKMIHVVFCWVSITIMKVEN